MANSDTLPVVINLLHTNTVGTMEIPCVVSEQAFCDLMAAAGLIKLADASNDLAQRSTAIQVFEGLIDQYCLFVDFVDPTVLFPGPNMLRTGLFESWRNRPDELAKERPRRTPYTTLEQYERLMAEAGAEVQYTPVEEVAGRVVDAVRAGEFWILPPSERTDEQIRARADSMLARANPTYLKETAQ